MFPSPVCLLKATSSMPEIAFLAHVWSSSLDILIDIDNRANRAQPKPETRLVPPLKWDELAQWYTGLDILINSIHQDLQDWQTCKKPVQPVLVTNFWSSGLDILTNDPVQSKVLTEMKSDEHASRDVHPRHYSVVVARL
jgi:hypothetical protein